MCIKSNCFHYVNHVTLPCANKMLTTLHVSSTLYREVSAELLQSDDTGLTLNPDKLIDLQQSEFLEESQHSGTEEDIEILERLHEDPTRQTEEPEMCEDVAQNVEPEQSEAVDNGEEALIQEAENAERIENSQEILELTENLEETSCSEQPDCDQTAFEEGEASPQPEHSESEQLEMTIEPEQIEEQHSEDSEQLGQSEHLEQSPQMELTEQSTQPENTEQTEESAQLEQTEETEESAQSEQSVCVDAEAIAEQQEQTEPTMQNEQSQQMTNSPPPPLPEQLVEPENSYQSEITEQMSPEAEVTQQTAEVALNQVGTQAETLQQAEEVGVSENGDAQTVIANGEQPKPPETAVPLMNGGEVDREMAHHLAERLYKLDGIQRVDVVKHLDKE